MKGFVFRLERLLQLRSSAERERAQAFGLAMREEEVHRQALEEASERLGNCGDQIAGVLDSVAPAGALTNLRLAIEAAMRTEKASLSENCGLLTSPSMRKSIAMRLSLSFKNASTAPRGTPMKVPIIPWDGASSSPVIAILPGARRRFLRTSDWMSRSSSPFCTRTSAALLR